MSDTGLTPGAMRVLDGAGRLAWVAGAAAAEPSHLLWALSLDESRASELLTECGIDVAIIGERFPRSTEGNDSLELPPVPIPLSPQLSDVVREARELARELCLDEVAGTEHLLSALAIVDETIAEFFRPFGLDAPGLRQRLQQPLIQATQPIVPEFEIHWHPPTETDRIDTLRTLDAAANRAREGLRVVEDFVRFSLDDAHLSRLLKELRHELTERLLDFDRLGLTAARDTLGDVGTHIKTSREQTRLRPIDVVVANCRRVEEALRTLEEFSKLLLGQTADDSAGEESTNSPQPYPRLADPNLPAHLESLRYRLYTIEKVLTTTLASRERLAGCDLYLLVTESLCHHGSGPAVRQALAAGVRIVQLREKTMTDRALVEFAHRIRQWTREVDALFIMNDRPDLAVLADADGVHVGQDELSVREARRIVGPHRLVGVSTHSIEQARQAVLDGADYLGVGPCFATSTKSFDQLAGLEFVRQVAAEITRPWFAIGGISLTNIATVRANGASRVAVSSAICSSPTPGLAAAELIEQLKPTSESVK
jgi:thiamine-phosphate pyrophosphorylase